MDVLLRDVAAAPTAPPPHTLTLCGAVLLPWTMDPETALPALLSDNKVGQQWQQLLDSVHDTGASRGNPWYASVVRESGPASATGETEYDSPAKPNRKPS